MDTEKIYRVYSRRLSATPTTFHRYLYGKIDWRDNLIGIKGPKGTGKTTMMLQHIKETFPDRSKALYASLDNLWFSTNSLEELIEDFYTHGGTHIFLDEVHYYPDWQTSLKNINDDYPGLNVVYSGSSMLKLDQAERGDLSRRSLSYTLAGMSFREYLGYEGIVDIAPVSLEDLLLHHVEIAGSVNEKGIRIQKHFDDYLRKGFYPFYKSVYAGYESRLQQIVDKILESDYPLTDDVKVSTIRKAKKMFMILAEREPRQVNLSSLFNELETDRNQGLKILYALQRAGLFNLLTDRTKTLDKMSRPEKIFLNNTNLMYSFASRPNIGMVRETFFFNQLQQGHTVNYPGKGDFLVDDRYLFEVGGKSKSFEQIKDMPDSFLAVDNTEIGHGLRIPLWMFGLLY